jgi:pimeloyl-ACP methyl ester carboxylesterase
MSVAVEHSNDPVFTSRYAEGERPITVVLLPALFVGDWLWDATWQELNQAGWPVIRFDQSVSTIDRHTGRSINRITTQLLRACRLRTAGPLVVCGDSLGGLIAFEFAKTYPQDVAGIVVSGAPGLSGVMNVGKSIGQDATDAEDFADRFLQKLLYRPEQYDIDQERFKALIEELSQKENIESMLGALQAIRRYEVKTLLPKLEAPALLLWGKYDEITPVEPWEEAVTGMTDARLVVFDNCGHAPMFEVPDGFTRELFAFLDKCESGAGNDHTVG